MTVEIASIALSFTALADLRVPAKSLTAGDQGNLVRAAIAATWPLQRDLLITLTARMHIPVLYISPEPERLPSDEEAAERFRLNDAESSSGTAP